MYGLPRGENFEFLTGASLSSYSMSRHQLNVTFNNPISASGATVISIEGTFSVELADQDEQVFQSIPHAAHHVALLLDLVITKALTHRPGTLALHFADGSILRMFDSSEHYESYQVTHSGAVIVV